jgi:plasmid maintenance system antidote protein VapI
MIGLALSSTLAPVMHAAQSEPVHPGAVLRERFLEPLGLTSSQVARAIGVLPGRGRMR